MPFSLGHEKHIHMTSVPDVCLYLHTWMGVCQLTVFLEKKRSYSFVCIEGEDEEETRFILLVSIIVHHGSHVSVRHVVCA